MTTYSTIYNDESRVKCSGITAWLKQYYPRTNQKVPSVLKISPRLDRANINIL